jgi:hypothetical protein
LIAGDLVALAFLITLLVGLGLSALLRAALRLLALLTRRLLAGLLLVLV